MNEPIKVTVTDPETGEVLGERVIDNDYIVICAGNVALVHTQIVGSTRILTLENFGPADMGGGQ